MEINKVQIWTKTQMLEINIKSQEDIDEVAAKLKELIEPKWKPKTGQYFVYPDGGVIHNGNGYGEAARLFGNEWPTKETAEIARDMNKRNQFILQYKLEKGYGDGMYGITYSRSKKEWSYYRNDCVDNPELSFETQEQAEETIKALGLNES